MYLFTNHHYFNPIYLSSQQTIL